MSDTWYDSQKDTFLQVHEDTVTLQRDANQFFTTHTIPLPYTDTGYVPQILAYYQDLAGRWRFTMNNWDTTLGTENPYTLNFSPQDSDIVFVVVGRDTDATVYQVVVKYFVYLNSLAED